MTLDELIKQIQNNTEWLSTTEDDEVECIGIENLQSILSEYFKQNLIITQE